MHVLRGLCKSKGEEGTRESCETCWGREQQSLAGSKAKKNMIHENACSPVHAHDCSADATMIANQRAAGRQAKGLECPMRASRALNSCYMGSERRVLNACSHFLGKGFLGTPQHGSIFRRVTHLVRLYH
jgi:hypothetical protein